MYVKVGESGFLFPSSPRVPEPSCRMLFFFSLEVKKPILYEGVSKSFEPQAFSPFR